MEEVILQRMFKEAFIKLFSKIGTLSLLRWLFISLMLQGMAKIFGMAMITILKVLLMATKFRTKWKNLQGEKSISQLLR